MSAPVESVAELQRRVCKAYRADYTPPIPGTKVGLALQTMGRIPVLGVRIPPTDTTNGWFIFAGDEPTADPDFYQPLCVEHVETYCPFAIPFLALPPGWRFYSDGQGDYGAEFDPALLAQE